MSLLSPLFLLGGLAIALPLWLHLLQRENPVRIPFSSLMFFQKRQQTSMRQRRLRHWLLLALRLMLLVLLGLAFAKPIWERTAGASLGSMPQLHLIALDTSLSMNHGDRWQRAVTEAESVIDSLGGADQAQIITMGPSVHVVTQRSAQREELKAALGALKPTASRNSYGDLAEAVRSLTPEEGLAVTLHVISDFQQSAMPGRFSDVALPAAAALVPHKVGEEYAPNWAVERVQGTTRIYGQIKPHIEATIAGFADEAATRQVTLLIDGKRIASQSVEVPASGRATVTFEGFAAPVGHSRAEVVLTPGDGLPLDDKMLVALENAQPESILFVSSDPRRRDLLYYRAALGASADLFFQVQAATTADVESFLPDRFALVVLSDVPQLSTTFLGRLESYVRSGGSVLIAAGPKIALAAQAPLFTGTINEGRYTGREEARFQLAGEVEQTHPVLQQVERFRGVKFFRYARLAPPEGADVLARLSDGSPLLVEQPLDAGRVLVLASSLDNIWNDLPVHPVFVPFVVESARHLAGLDQDTDRAVIDSVLELRRRRSSGSTVQVFDPSGERVLSLSQSVERQDVRVDQIGFYEVRRTGESDLVAVNPDPRESNLRPVDADTLALWEATGRSEQTLEAAAGDPGLKPPPVKIWWFVLILLGLVALLESIVGHRHLKIQREV